MEDPLNCVPNNGCWVLVWFWFLWGFFLFGFFCLVLFWVFFWSVVLKFCCCCCFMFDFFGEVCCPFCCCFCCWLVLVWVGFFGGGRVFIFVLSFLGFIFSIQGKDLDNSLKDRGLSTFQHGSTNVQFSTPHAQRR